MRGPNVSSGAKLETESLTPGTAGSIESSTGAASTWRKRSSISDSACGTHSGSGSDAVARPWHRSMKISACDHSSRRVYASAIRQAWLARASSRSAALNASIASE